MQSAMKYISKLPSQKWGVPLVLHQHRANILLWENWSGINTAKEKIHNKRSLEKFKKCQVHVLELSHEDNIKSEAYGWSKNIPGCFWINIQGLSGTLKHNEHDEIKNRNNW